MLTLVWTPKLSPHPPLCPSAGLSRVQPDSNCIMSATSELAAMRHAETGAAADRPPHGVSRLSRPSQVHGNNFSSF